MCTYTKYPTIMCANSHTGTLTSTWTCVQTWVHARSHTNARPYTCAYAHRHMQTRINTPTHKHTLIQSHTHIHTNAQLYTHIYMHSHPCTRAQQVSNQIMIPSSQEFVIGYSTMVSCQCAFDANMSRSTRKIKRNIVRCPWYRNTPF